MSISSRSFAWFILLFLVYGSFFLISPVQAQLVSGRFCRYQCTRSATDRTPQGTITDFDAACDLTGPRSADRCLDRCNGQCGTGRCIETSPTCIEAVAELRCACPCKPSAASTEVVTVVGEANYCRSVDGRPDASSCTSVCGTICSRQGKIFITGRPGVEPQCRTAATTTPMTPPRSSQNSAPPLNLTFPDPLGGNVSVNALIGGIVRIAVGLVGVLFLGVFIWSGLSYLTAGGDAAKTKTAKSGLVNAVIGLAVVMSSYILVSFVIEASNRLQGRESSLESSSSRASSTTSGRGVRSSEDTRSADSSFGGGPVPTPGSAQEACRRFYGGDRSTCESSGSCPVGVTSFDQLLSAWGRDLPPATPGGPAPAEACRTCINRQIETAQGLYPGLDDSCVPALTNAWRGVCMPSCSRGGTSSGTGGGTGTVCDLAAYNTSARDTGSTACNRCIAYWTEPDHLAIVAGVGCSEPREKAAVWCSTQETRSRHESPGYCNLLRRR